MADTPFERFKKDQQEQQEQTKPGEIRDLNQFQNSFLKALENIGEPTPPTKFLRPFKEAFKDPAESKDTSLLRFGIFLDPALRATLSVGLSKKEGKRVDVLDYLESKDEKDYISLFDEVRKGVDAGSFDLGQSVGTLLFAGTDLALNTDFLSKFEDFMKDKEPSQPETWRGDLTALLTQFGVPGSIIAKIVGRTKTVGRLKKTVDKVKGANKQKISKIAARAIEGATIVGATDFIASQPGRESLFFEPEDTKGLTGRKKAAAEFRNKIKYGAEGTLIGGGFPIVGKGFQLGYKYGLAPFVKTSAKLGTKAVNQTVFRPAEYLLSRPLVSPIVTGAAKKVRQATDFTLTKALAPSIVSAFSRTKFQQLPPFEQWRLFSVSSPNVRERTIKKLDNVLSAFRSYGKNPKDIEGISETVSLFIKGRARKLDRTIEGLEKKAYSLAKQNQVEYNKGFTSPALQKHYLDQIEDYLRGNIRKADLPKELQPVAQDVRKEVIDTMTEFKKALPKGKQADDIVKDLQKIEVDRVGSYLVKSFSTFTNPEFVPEKKIFNKAVDYVKDKVVKKNKNLKIDAVGSFPNVKPEQAYKNSAEMMVNRILHTGRAEGKSPIKQLKEIGTKILLNDKYRFLKTGEELPDAIKNLLGPEKNLKSSVAFTTSEAISSMANKRAMDAIAKSGLNNRWLFRSKQQATNAGVIDAEQILKVPRLGNYMRSEITDLYASPEYVQMFQGVGGVLDNLINIPIYREIMQGKVAIQVGKTLYSPQTQVRNVSSASFFALMNGHIGGRASVTDAMKIVLDDIFKAGQRGIDEVAFNDYVEKLVRLGVFDENVVASELKAVMNQLKNRQIRTTDQLFDKLIKMTPTDKVARLYAGGDNLWKHYGFEYSRSQLIQGLKTLDDVKKWFGSMGQTFSEVSTVTGQVKSFDDALDEAAAYLIRNTYPTYSKVPPAIQTLRKFPLGAFISFPAEILRTGTNIISTGLKEASSSNEVIRQMGIRRLLGASLTSYAGGAGIVQIAQFLTNSTDAQWDAYKRSSAAPWDANSNLLAIEGWKDGESAAINFSYFSPYDSLWAPMSAALAKANEQKLNPQETEQYVLELMFAENGPIMTFLDPFITEPIGYDRFIDVTTRQGRKAQGGTVYSQSDSLGDKFAKSFVYILDGVKPGVFSSADKISGALSKDLTRGGKPLNLKDELLALFAGTRIIRIDVKKDLRYFASEMNRLLRATDENEQFYNVDNYADNTPQSQINTFREMQEEAFRIQKDMFIRIKDLQLLDLDDDDIEDILIESGVSKKLTRTLMDGEFTPVNYSKKRFERKVNTIDKELRKASDGNFNFRLNEDYVFPEDGLDDIIDEYEDKAFFERGQEYEPEKFDYKLDGAGRLILDDNNSPIRDEGLIKRGLRKISPVIREGLNKVINPLAGVGDISKAPPLPRTPSPVIQPPVQQAGLTQTETALLSPEEQIIRQRTKT